MGDADCRRARAKDVGRRRRLDRSRHVQVRRRGQIDRCGEVQAKIYIRVDVEQGQHLLVGKRDGILRLDLLCQGVLALVPVHRYALVHQSLLWSLCALSRLLFPAARPSKRARTDV
jgi:hypothetical protein